MLPDEERHIDAEDWQTALSDLMDNGHPLSDLFRPEPDPVDLDRMADDGGPA